MNQQIELPGYVSTVSLSPEGDIRLGFPSRETALAFFMQLPDPTVVPANFEGPQNYRFDLLTRYTKLCDVYKTAYDGLWVTLRQVGRNFARDTGSPIIRYLTEEDFIR